MIHKYMKIAESLAQILKKIGCWFQSTTKTNKSPEECKPGCTSHQKSLYAESLLKLYNKWIEDWNDDDIEGQKGHSYCVINCYQHKKIKGDMHYCGQSSPTTWVQHESGAHDAVCVYWGMLSSIISIHTYIHTYIHSYIHTYIHIYIYISDTYTVKLPLLE